MGIFNMYIRSNRDPIIATDPIIHQWFNYFLRYTLLNGVNNFGEMEDREYLRYALGIYTVIGGNEILVKEFQISKEDKWKIFENPDYPKMYTKDEVLTNDDFRDRERLAKLVVCREIKKTIDEKYIPIAKKYMEIKAEEHIRAEMKIAKELGIEYKGISV